MNAVRRILAEEDDRPELDICALEIARIEEPGLDGDFWLGELDRHADQIRRRSLLGFRHAAQTYLFEECGFGGNEADYYNPRNSCLHHVLQTRKGIPITLCVIYMELGRRLGVGVDGIGAPGHFLVRVEEDGDDFYIDPFQGGKLREEAEEELGPNYLVPASKRSILIRMLQNLRLIYLQRQAWPKARQVLDLLLVANPEDADALRHRAAARAATQQFVGAAEDLLAYLKIRPFDADKTELERQVGRLQRLQSLKN